MGKCNCPCSRLIDEFRVNLCLIATSMRASHWLCVASTKGIPTMQAAWLVYPRFLNLSSGTLDGLKNTREVSWICICTTSLTLRTKARRTVRTLCLQSRPSLSGNPKCVHLPPLAKNRMHNSSHVMPCFPSGANAHLSSSTF